jgi:hypothetical protein
MLRRDVAAGCRQQPAAVVRCRVHGRRQRDVRRQVEPVDPGLDVREDVRLEGAGERQVAQRPVRRGDLDVLPRRQAAPQAADRRLRIEDAGVQPGLPGVVEGDHSADTGADDRDVEFPWRALHGASSHGGSIGGRCKVPRPCAD